MIVEIGGSTVDSTLYECKAVEPHVELQEVCASECVQVSHTSDSLSLTCLYSFQAGGVFVDRAAKRMLEAKLARSKFNDPESIRDMVKAFESKVLHLD